MPSASIAMKLPPVWDLSAKRLPLRPLAVRVICLFLYDMIGVVCFKPLPIVSVSNLFKVSDRVYVSVHWTYVCLIIH